MSLALNVWYVACSRSCRAASRVLRVGCSVPALEARPAVRRTGNRAVRSLAGRRAGDGGESRRAQAHAAADDCGRVFGRLVARHKPGSAMLSRRVVQYRVEVD